MYTNSKDQRSLEEAYRHVHAEEVVEETFLDGATSSDILEVLRLALTSLISGLFISHVIRNKERAALLIDTVLGNPEVKKAIQKHENLVNDTDGKHDAQNLIQAHNLKMQIVKLGGDKLFNLLHDDLVGENGPSTYWEKLKAVVNHFKKPFSQKGELSK